MWHFSFAAGKSNIVYLPESEFYEVDLSLTDSDGNLAMINSLISVPPNHNTDLIVEYALSCEG